MFKLIGKDCINLIWRGKHELEFISVMDELRSHTYYINDELMGYYNSYMIDSNYSTDYSGFSITICIICAKPKKYCGCKDCIPPDNPNDCICEDTIGLYHPLKKSCGHRFCVSGKCNVCDYH